MSSQNFLFAVRAQELLDADNSDEALDLCLRGVSVYPDYPAGLLMLCESYFDKEDFTAAKEILDKALLKFPRYEPLRLFEERLGDAVILKEIGEEFENEELTDIPEVQVISWTDSIDDAQVTPDELVITTADINFIDQAITEETKPQPKTEAGNFLKLVSKLDSETSNEQTLRADNPALIPGLTFAPLRASKKSTSEDYNRQPTQFPEFYSPFDDYSEEGPDNINNYASDTIAGILESQGAYHEAIEVYQELSLQQPEKKEYYDAKINSILGKIRD